MNDEVLNTSKRTLPLWLIVLFISALVLMVSAFGMSAYKKSQVRLPSQSQQTLLDMQKTMLLAQEDVIDTVWLHTLNPMIKQVEGRLIWSSNKQLGMVSFNNLPKIKNNQQYHLYIYDLNAASNQAVSALVIKQKFTGRFEQEFKPTREISAPLKFELVLEEDNGKSPLPLLLAQP